jgi:FixJ family two-component response regulator
MTESDSVVFVIDDDLSVRRGLTYLLQSADYRVEAFESAEKFLARHHFSGSGCIILDVRLTGMTGLDLQEELSRADYHLPIIFITGHGDISMGVDAMKKGAVDFLAKPFDDDQLLGAVKQAIEQDRRARAKYDELQSIRHRLEKLTPREYEIFRYVITGLLNKQIAAELNIAEQTVKIHRGRVMEKLGTYSVPDLVRMAEKAGISPPNLKPA